MTRTWWLTYASALVWLIGMWATNTHPLTVLAEAIGMGLRMGAALGG